MLRVLFWLLVALGWPHPVGAEPPALQLWEESYLTLRAGATAQMLLHASVREGYAVVARADKRGKLLPLSLKMERHPQLGLGEPLYPAPDAEAGKPPAAGGDAQFYRGTIAIRLPVSAPASVEPGVHALKGLLSYQACAAQRCLPAMAVPVELTVTIREKPPDR